MATISLVIIFVADGMPGFKEEVGPVYDSQFKVFLNTEVQGDKFWFRKAGNDTSGSDWSQGWECMGEQLDAVVTGTVETDKTVDPFTDEKLAPSTTNATEVEIGIKKMCEAHAASFEDPHQDFTCCMIARAGDKNQFTVHRSSKMRWTGTSKALVLPSKAYTNNKAGY